MLIEKLTNGYNAIKWTFSLNSLKLQDVPYMQYNETVEMALAFLCVIKTHELYTFILFRVTKYAYPDQWCVCKTM